ncbi:MAG TPA: S9 family peptidase [Gemmatimonadaceae bacterium]|nr:S9 family peptidase [Gemmatimonadaceae bacterium]
MRGSFARLAFSFVVWSIAAPGLAAQGRQGQPGQQARPAQPAGPAWTPQLQSQVKRIQAVSVAPDGRRVAFEVATADTAGERSEWVSQLFVADADGSAARQLTYGERSSRAPAWSPDGQWIAFLSTREGKSDLYRLSVGGGEAQRLTRVKSGVVDFAWAPGGDRIALLITDSTTTAEDAAAKEKRDVRVIDESPKLARLHVLELSASGAAGAPRLLTPGSVHVQAGEFDWAPDGTAIVYSFQPTPSMNDWPRADVAVIELVSGTRRVLAATRRAETTPRYAPDGASIAFTASDDPPTWGFTSRVYVVPAAGGEPRALAESYDGQPDLLGWSGDGARVLIAETRRSVGRVSALPGDGGAPVDVSAADAMVTGARLNATRTHLGFVSQDVDRPPEAWIAALGARFEPKQVSRVQTLPEAPLGRTEVVRWRSTDGTEIEGLLTTPVGWRQGTRVPLLVVVHGGPTGVFTRTFIGVASQYPVATFAAKGYAVLRCNVRGSSGYGRQFRYANYKDWGGGDYQDIMSGVDAMVTRGIADSTRLGIMGWSYGGYMTSWVITQTKRFRAASVGAGVTNLMSFTGTADIPGFIPDYFGGEFWDTFDAWRGRSAMFHVKGVTTPTLIQHGEEDRRVPVSQGYELYNALRRQNVATRMVVYPRMGHGLTEPKFQLDAAERNLEWFERWLAARAATQ